MNYTYMDRIKQCIKTALRECPCTFEELVKECYGAYPLVVEQALNEMKIHNTYTPLIETSDFLKTEMGDAAVRLFVTQPELVPYNIYDAEVDYRRSELVTYRIDNNPILSNWYFSWQTCSKIMKLDIWRNKRILFLGVPRLFEYFIVQQCTNDMVLVDLDGCITKELKIAYGDRKNILIINEDINSWSPKKHDFDVVFLDPPWYLGSYFSWLGKAFQTIKPDGVIAFSLFPYLLRPTASEERKKLYKYCREQTDSIFSVVKWLEYDIPTFEKQQLAHANLNVRTNWKVSDFIILQGMKAAPSFQTYNEAKEVDLDYKGWQEFNLFGMRWFLNQKRYGGNDADGALLSLEDGSLYLKSPSRRNKQFLRMNLLSSQGHGLTVNNIQKFLAVVDDIEKNKDKPLQTIVNNLDIDEMSKQIILQIGDGK